MKTALIAGALALALTASVARADPANPMIGLFAQSASLANEFELAEAKIMLEDSKTPALRAFAEQMMRDHGAAQRQLQAAGRATGVPTAFVFGTVQQQKIDDIGLMDGSKLDETYLADQVAAHAAAAATLEGYAVNGTSPPLVAYARATLPVVLEHQRMLERLTGQPKPL